MNPVVQAQKEAVLGVAQGLEEAMEWAAEELLPGMAISVKILRETAKRFEKYE